MRGKQRFSIEWKTRAIITLYQRLVRRNAWLRASFVFIFYCCFCKGFNVETISPCRGITLTVWDVGGQDKLRALWHHYLDNIDGFVFVIDSTDHQRLGIAKAELISIYQYDSMKNVPLVVIVNKQDSPDALSADVIAEKLDLKRLTSSLHYITPCCALSGDGLTDAFSMLAKLIRKQTKKNRLVVMWKRNCSFVSFF